jgi:hypothetical protein
MKSQDYHIAPARWTPGLLKLPAISVRQPWAWLIVNGYKDIENRKWATNVRGRVLIHAGRSTADLYFDVQEQLVRGFKIRDLPSDYHTGGIVGFVDIVDCVEKHRSKWFRGPYGWALANSRPLPFRRCPGMLKFFTPDL